MRRSAPPLSFLASWVSTRLGHSPEVLRLPALLAGTATIPLVFALGTRTIGRRPALLASALTALSPFMIYYSAEARAYGLMMCFVVAAILSMMCALDTGRRRFWGAFAVFSAAAFLTHYTSAFVLAAAVVWLLWFEPQARRPALISVAVAAVLVVPWIPGLIEDLRSPTVTILSALSPFTAHAVRIDIEHWGLGYPYSSAGGLRALPGTLALALLALAVVLVVIGIVTRLWTVTDPRSALRVVQRDIDTRRRRLVLVGLLLLATPLCEILASAFGNHIIGVRDLAASWPFLALGAAAVVIAAGPRVGLVAGTLAVIAFGLGAAKMLDSRFQRPDYQGGRGVRCRRGPPR